MNKNLNDKLKYLDSIFINIEKLSTQLNILHDLNFLKTDYRLSKLSKIIKIIKFINDFKQEIRSEILKNFNNNTYENIHFEKYLVKNLNISKTIITNQYKYKLSYKQEFNNLKNSINYSLKNMEKSKKIKIKNIIVDFHRYCSDYKNKEINKYVINKMNKYKFQIDCSKN